MIDLSQIEQQINCDDRILAAYLFGSAVEDQMRIESDIDIALLLVSGRKLSPLDLLEMATSLTSSAERTVDLGVMSSQNLIYSSQAILTGHRFLCRDQYEADLSIATLLGLTVQFKFERREIVNGYTN
jgi:predicted nucleotidyltransferase